MSRRSYLLRRLGHLAGAFTILISLNFFLPRAMPGDPTTYFVQPGFTQETRQHLLEKFGLNEPLWLQFMKYAGNTLTGDFGVSFKEYPTPVAELILNALPNTLILMLGSVILSFIIGVPLGAIAAWNFGKRTDIAITNGTLFIRSIPAFWIGLILLFVFGYMYPIFPLAGARSATITFVNPINAIQDRLWHSVLPVVSLAAYFTAGYAFLMRASLLDVLPENYIKIAQSKGLSNREVLFKHALKPGALPVLTRLGFQLGRVIGGIVIIEVVFSYPGMGKLLYDAVLARDFPTIQGVFFMLVTTVLVAMFLIDLLYVILDPRVAE